MLKRWIFIAPEEQSSNRFLLALSNCYSDSGEHLSELEESLIIIEAIREASLSKFLPEDVLPFEKIIEDVFPGVTVSKMHHPNLEVMRPWETVPGHLEVESVWV